MIYTFCSPYGTALVIENDEEFEIFINQLIGLREVAQTDDINYPVLYSRAHDAIPIDEHEKFTDWLKQVVQYAYPIDKDN